MLQWSKSATRRVQRGQRLPSYPSIEVITELDQQSYTTSNFTAVRYGEYDFSECRDRFVNVYIQSYKQPKGIPSTSPASFAVYYGPNHPLYVDGLTTICDSFLTLPLRLSKITHSNRFFFSFFIKLIEIHRE